MPRGGGFRGGGFRFRSSGSSYGSSSGAKGSSSKTAGSKDQASTGFQWPVVCTLTRLRGGIGLKIIVTNP